MFISNLPVLPLSPPSIAGSRSEVLKRTPKKDTPFVALALEMEAQLWTRDQELKDGLRRKGFDRFFDENEE